MDTLESPKTSDVVHYHIYVASDEPASIPVNKDVASHSNAQERPHHQSHPDTAAGSTTYGKSTRTTFSDLPAELREMIWEYALPDSRVFNALVYASAGLKMQLLERSSLRMPIAHVCFESRQVVLKAGYRLAFRDEDEPDDPGVFFHPHRDVIERTLWGPGDFWGLK
ncbi:uncharacterized protein F4807DRAFT_456383 [Annulohypoxylon truncatum]|uniref:uncharacterized protein n=1 Tax=Annulohypoxylon truncatum TaxID=327061 RepID=UPI00200732A5|nr:uncharacterized protein F4807DRAFT_456383 [Annulohypoxylon truncatum]KAI1213835.1 hypothetical protein F4807DRAFT_456383 [Annulohypoxylon truncatum]